MNDGNFEKKLKILNYIIYFAFLVIIIRLFYLQVIKGNYFQDRANRNMFRTISIKGPRGIIFDSRDNVMVKNIPSYSLYIIPQDVMNISSVIRTLSSILGTDQKKLYAIISKNEKNLLGAVRIKDNLSYSQFACIEELKDSLKGVYCRVESKRSYVDESTGHLIGYIGLVNESEYERLKDKGYSAEDYIGKQGIEKKYEEDIRGVDGKEIIKVDVAGNFVSFEGIQEPREGSRIQLTVNSRLQKKAYDLLKNKVDQLKGEGKKNTGAALIALDPRNGKVISLVSYPVYDPNKFVKGYTYKEYDKLITDNFNPLVNRTITSSFPAASTFKEITSIAALEEGIAKGDSWFYCPGTFNMGGTIFNCDLRSGHGNISFTDSIGKSCDVVFYRFGNTLGVGKMGKYAEMFGVGEKTGIDLDEETNGLLPGEKWKKETYNEEWYPGDTINMSIGQGFVLVTPLQVAVYTSIIANGGNYYKPYVVNKIFKKNGDIINRIPVLKRKLDIKEENFDAVRKGMRSAVTNGTARIMDIKEIEVAGKTGTA